MANLTLAALDLGDNSIGDNGAQALAGALKTNSTLTTLDLYNNSIGDYGAFSLSEALKTNSTLTTLVLSNNWIGPNGTGALAEALKTNSTLTILNLEWNSIGYDGVQALSDALKANSILTTLNLSNNSIEPDEAQVLFEALKTNSTLTTLLLSHNSIGPIGAQALSRALKNNSTLTTLELWGNSIGPNGAQVLSKALKTNATLTSLDLGENSIGDNGAQVLSEALKTNKTLTFLSLEWNLIRNDGAQALSEALMTNSTLATLNLGENSIGEAGAQSLSKALKTNLTLTILSLNFMKGNMSYFSITLGRRNIGSTSANFHLSRSTYWKDQAPDAGFSYVKVINVHHDSWEGHSIWSRRISGIYSSHLEYPLAHLASGTLQKLTIELFDVMFDETLHLFVREHSGLHELNISTSECYVPYYIRSVVKMWLRSSNLLRLTLLERVHDGRGRVIARLVVPKCHATGQHPSVLTSFTLDISNLTPCGLLCTLDILSRSHLRYLHVLCSAIDPTMSLSISHVLQAVRLEELPSLFLSGDNFDEWIQLWATNIPSLLRRLDICGTGLYQKKLYHSSVLAAQRVVNESPLVELNFSNIELQDKHDWAIVVDIGSSGGDECGRLAEPLKTDSTLTTLDLQRNLIGDRGALVLFEALKSNSSRTTLNLQNNMIEGNGARALAEAFKTNATLATLELRRNSIGEVGAQALSEALKTNLTLTILW
ncbi:hypothetical protein BGZ93_008395 [Podila epicladia]|nr:hypothetical protein BGZ93_008395 [Podila epicladia]